MVKWTPKAEDDLYEINKHITQNFNEELAIQVVFELVDHVENILSKNPLAGLLVESNPFFSKLVYQGNSVYYCENPKDHHLYVVYVQPRGTDLEKIRINTSEVD